MLDPHPEVALIFAILALALVLARVLAILALAFAATLVIISTRRCESRALIVQLTSGPYKALNGLIRLLRAL